MQEQLRLFDPTDYIGMDGSSYIEIDFSEEQLEFIQNAAIIEGVDVNTYIINALRALVESEKSKNANVPSL